MFSTDWHWCCMCMACLACLPARLYVQYCKWVLKYKQRHPASYRFNIIYIRIPTYMHMSLCAHCTHVYLPSTRYVTCHTALHTKRNNTEWMSEQLKKTININRNSGRSSSSSSNTSASAHGKIIFGCFVCAFIFGICMTATDAFVPFCVVR